MNLNIYNVFATPSVCSVESQIEFNSLKKAYVGVFRALNDRAVKETPNRRKNCVSRNYILWLTFLLECCSDRSMLSATEKSNYK